MAGLHALLKPRHMPGAGKHILKCLLSPDAKTMATTSSDKTIKLWNVDGFTEERTLTGAARCSLC